MEERDGTSLPTALSMLAKRSIKMRIGGLGFGVLVSQRRTEDPGMR